MPWGITSRTTMIRKLLIIVDGHELDCRGAAVWKRSIIFHCTSPSRLPRSSALGVMPSSHFSPRRPRRTALYDDAIGGSTLLGTNFNHRWRHIDAEADEDEK